MGYHPWGLKESDPTEHACIGSHSIELAQLAFADMIETSRYFGINGWMMDEWVDRQMMNV